MKIFIVDKQALFREGLIWMLDHQTDFDVAGQAASGYEDVEKVAALQPEVLLLENVLPDGPGFKFIPLREPMPIQRAHLLQVLQARVPSIEGHQLGLKASVGNRPQQAEQVIYPYILY